MKYFLQIKQIHILLFILATLLSCNKNDEKSQLQDLLVGEWKLSSFVDEANGTSIESSNPDYYDPIDNTEVLIVVDFKEDSEFEGVTSRNSLGGNYTLNNSETVLIFYCDNPNDGHCIQTEVNETEFGNLFFDNLRLNYNSQTQNTESGFEINEDVFKLYYSENEYMKFERM